jgi:hypothetical protein
MGEYTRVIQDADEFLRDRRDGALLSGPAAVNACLLAGFCDLYVGRIEGGIFHDPGFESRMDSIWTGIREPESREEAVRWNQEAAAFVSDQMTTSPDPNLPPCDVFILVMGRMPD